MVQTISFPRLTSHAPCILVQVASEQSCECWRWRWRWRWSGYRLQLTLTRTSLDVTEPGSGCSCQSCWSKPDFLQTLGLQVKKLSLSGLGYTATVTAKGPVPAQPLARPSPPLAAEQSKASSTLACLRTIIRRCVPRFRLSRIGLLLRAPTRTSV